MAKDKNQAYNELMEFEKTIYGILKEFEKQLDSKTFDPVMLDYKAWKVSEIRFIRYLSMLLDAGYIEGISITPMQNGTYYVNPVAPVITLKGLEYLAENSMMRKVAEVLKKGAGITIQALV